MQSIQCPRAVRMRQWRPEDQGLPVKNAEISTVNAGYGPSRLSAASDDAWQASGYVCLMGIKVQSLMEEKEVGSLRACLKCGGVGAAPCQWPSICMQELHRGIVVMDTCIQTRLAPRYMANIQSSIRVRQRRRAVTASTSQTVATTFQHPNNCTETRCSPPTFHPTPILSKHPLRPSALDETHHSQNGRQIPFPRGVRFRR